MKKKLLFPCLLLSVVMLITCVCAFGVGAETEPNKTMANVTVATPAVAGDIVAIATEQDLADFSKYVSDGGNTEGVEFRLTDDIALTPLVNKRGAPYTNFKPIGGMYDGTAEVVAFKGVFNGNGKTISCLQISEIKNASNAKITEQQGAYSGLFAKLEGATVKDLTVKVTLLQAVGKDGAVGVIAAEAVNSTFENCVVSKDDAAGTGYISGLKSGAVFGGIVGNATGSVLDACTSALEVTGNGTTGGLVGVATDTFIRNSVVGGTYKHTVASALGGVVGELKGTSAVENCYSSATVETTLNGDFAGGVAAKVEAGASVENCFSAATVTATGTTPTFGTIVGLNDGTVHHSFALRAEPDFASLLKAHNDIGGGNGTATQVYAYQPKTEDGETEFLVGTVVKSENVACWEIAGSLCTEGAPNADCPCGGDGVLQEMYRFTAGAEIGSLFEALNAWVSEKLDSGVAYSSWIISNETITNCSHGATTYIIDKDNNDLHKASTCKETGIGDKFCSTCGVLLEKNATVPVDPSAHSQRPFACVDYNCEYCGEFFPAPATAPHSIGDKHCIDQECERCHTMVAATASHTNPDYDANKPCAEYDCSVCGTHTHDGDHDIKQAEFACEDTACTVCGFVEKEGKAHRPGRAANCLRAQTCMVCNTVIIPIKKCVPGTLETCGNDQVCTNCGQNECVHCQVEGYTVAYEYEDENGVTQTGYKTVFGKATGDHTWNREHSSCTVDKQCKVCSLVAEEKTGHSPDEAHAANCGKGRVCLACHVVLEAAVGDHKVDWAKATVVRAATADRTGIVVGVCSVCEREVEAYTTCVAMENSGNALVTGGSLTFYAGTHVKAEFGKVADYKNVAFADGYLPLQVVTLSIHDSNGAAISVSGGVTVKVVLNKSAAKMANGTLKLYSVKNGKATEVTITAQEDGYVTFSTTALGTFVLAGEKTAAFTVLGSIPVQAKQTAALVGTASYDRRDFDI